jgi:hypothetical protein
MADPTAAFTKMVPGFDFLEGLVKNAGAALPSVGQWIAPTLNPDEIDKRIEELRTVQFWLEQNVRMLGATIQALEVQRMTLSTLRTMNVSVGELRDSMMLRRPQGDAASAPDDTAPRKGARNKPAPARADASALAPHPGIVDPMQWWGALTRQFTELAATAMRDSAAGAVQGPADPMVWPPADAAGAASIQAAAPSAAGPPSSAAGQPAVGNATAARKRPATKRRRTQP